MIKTLKIITLTIILFFTAINVNAVDMFYEPGYEIIIDNSSQGFTAAGDFVTSNNSNAYNGTVTTISAASQNAAATWTPTIPSSGNYRIYISYPRTENTAQYTNVQIVYNDGNSSYGARKINQNLNTGCWVYLGTYYMPEGNNNYVKITADSDGVIVADAVKFVLNSETVLSGNIMEDVSSAVEYNENEAVLVQDMETGDNYLTVNGEPYYIKGVCKSDIMAKVSEAGGNTVRTYSALKVNNTTKKILDEAQSLGMKVVLGLDMPRANNSFNYKENYDTFKSVYFNNFKIQINEFKDHPALLMWAVGNEVDILNSESGEAVYQAIQEVAAYIKSVDPYHPVTTVHAGTAVSKISSVMKYVPCADIVSANVYKGIGNAYDNIITTALWQGPYMITEYSTNQPSEEVAAGEFIFDDTVIEKADYLKAKDYYDRYINYIYSNKSDCIGSFAFASYDTYRGTHTWYNIFSVDYKKTPVYDALYYAWNGKERENTSPVIKSIKLADQTAADGIVFEYGDSAVLEIEAADKENDMLIYKFEVRKIDMDTLYEPVADVKFTADSENPSKVLVSNLPGEEGIYRLFVYAYDENDNMGYGNIPFKIEKHNGADKLSKERFFGISALGAAYTAPAENGFTGTWKSDLALSSTSTMDVLNLGEYSVAAATANGITKNLFNELQTPLDMDSDTDYYAKWIQGYTALESTRYVKVGFAADGTSGELSTIFMWDNGVPKLGIKAGTAASYSSKHINSGSLYNVLFRIDANPTGNDIIMVKVWPTNCSQPYDWTYSVEKEITGEYSVVFMQSNCANGSRAYFGEFSLESFKDGEEEKMLSAYEEVGQYLRGNTEIPLLSDLSGFVAYRQIKDLLRHKNSIYIKEAALYADDERISFIPPESMDGISVSVVLGNDNAGAVTCQNNIYIACYDDNGIFMTADSVSGENINESEKEFLFDVSSDTKTVKLFYWNDRLQPVCSHIQILQTGIINY